jgi:cytidine deaminase
VGGAEILTYVSMPTKLTKQDKELMKIGTDLIRKRMSIMSTVACGLRTTSGNVYTGVNIEQIHSSPCSMCAEYAAIGSMHAEDDAEIETIVAIDTEGIVLPPCGKCREMIRQFGDPFVILQEKKGDRYKVRLSTLLPFWDSSESMNTRY